MIYIVIFKVSGRSGSVLLRSGCLCIFLLMISLCFLMIYWVGMGLVWIIFCVRSYLFWSIGSSCVFMEGNVFMGLSVDFFI